MQADNGDPIAQNNLGWTYLYEYNEYNIEKNTEKGSFYIRRAAEQNQVNAMATLGWNSFTGEQGFIQNDLEAIYWNEQASNLGFAISSHNLGFFYYSEEEITSEYAYIPEGDGYGCSDLTAFNYNPTAISCSADIDDNSCCIYCFGKTENAIRAAFKAVDNGKQVAIFVPTTI